MTTNSQLTLGPFIFEGLEVPERIVLKSRQRVIVHHLGSGASAMDSLGEDPQSITFQGTFTGPNTANRIRSIDHLRVLGAPVFFRWSSQILFVIVREFELSYKSSQWTDYKLSCLVMPSAPRDIEETDEILTISASSRVKDIIDLLRDTGISLAAFQAEALVTLAQFNRDEIPLASSRSAQWLLSMIDGALTTLRQEAAGELMKRSYFIETMSREAQNLINASGGMAKLVNARNRLVDIMVRAESVNES